MQNQAYCIICVLLLFRRGSQSNTQLSEMDCDELLRRMGYAGYT
jgi:hypothetical protein